MTSQAAPLIDLHRHLDGNIRLKTILSLAKKHQLELAKHTEESLASLVYIKDKTSDLVSFLQKLDIGVSVICNEEDCFRIAYENVQDAVNQGLAHVELRFSPAYMARTHDLPLSKVVEAVVNGTKQANIDFSYQATLIGILSRTFGQQQCAKELDALLSCAENIAAIDLAGDEIAYPAHLFINHFQRVREAGLPVTVHAGEAAGPESIWAAIKLLGATRIGHSVAAQHSQYLMDYMREHQIGIESCLTSNYQTACVSNLKNHPVTCFLKNDIPVCLNTDDPGVSNITLHSEYMLAKNVLCLTQQQIATLQQHSIDMAFLSEQQKNALKKAISLSALDFAV